MGQAAGGLPVAQELGIRLIVAMMRLHKKDYTK